MNLAPSDLVILTHSFVYSFIHSVFLEHLFILGQALCEAWVFHCEQLGVALRELSVQ